MDLVSVAVGYIFCMFCYIVFAVAQYFLEKARYYADLRKFARNSQIWGSDE